MSTVKNIEAILDSLTLEEKISLLAGKDFWQTVDIPSKGVPSIKTTDGPNGARGADFTGGTPAACFPAASSVAATFDVNIAAQVGKALGREAQSKGGRCLLGPTMCIHRHPLGGRNFESFSEDPFLSGKLGAQVVTGLQSVGVAATIKHFAANEQETDRMTANETIGERALREIYLKPFEMSIKEAKPWAVMTAYNLVNGEHADSNKFLLRQVLRGDWGWDGLVMSDWGGTNSVGDSIESGLDLEMPGPARKRKIPSVLEAVKQGEVTEEAITARARNVLKFLDKLKAFENPNNPPEQAIDRPEDRALIRRAGADGIVLLKNEGGILPLTKAKSKGKKIAVLGMAKESLAHGGGSASVQCHYKVSPWQALQETLGPTAELSYAQGAHMQRLLAPLGENVHDEAGGKGWTRRLIDHKTKEIVSTMHGHQVSEFSPLGSSDTLWREIELVGSFTPQESGNHYIGATGIGPLEVHINGELIYDQKKNCKDPMGYLFGACPEGQKQIAMEAGKAYRIKIRSQPPVTLPEIEILEGRSGLRFGFMLESDHDKDLTVEAVELAKNADIALVFTGHTPQWETEGVDQAGFSLPRDGSLDKLVSAVAKVNQNTIVVNSTGVAVAMPWKDEVCGLLQAWFGGQECGNAIVDVLTGAVNPGGRLPVSFPKRIEDAPAHGNFYGEIVDGRREVTYAEGVFVGYRHYDRVAKEILNFPFGFGLSYTTFECSDLEVVEATADTYSVTVSVKNTGSTGGSTVVQIYVGEAETKPENPIKALVGFQKVHLEADEEKDVELSVAKRDFAFFRDGKWVVDAGKYNFTLGRSAAEAISVTQVMIQDGVSYGL